MIEATIADHSDQIRIIWFNQIYLLKVIKPGIKVIVKGKLGNVKKQYPQAHSPVTNNLAITLFI